MKSALLALLFVAGAVVFALHDRELARARAELRRHALAADSVEAARDSSRLVRLRISGDSMIAAQRRIMQVSQRADSLDRALHLERVARSEVEVRVHDLVATAVSRTAAPSEDSLRRGEFAIDDAPYHVTASVSLPRPPTEGKITVRVRLDSMTILARIGCGAAGPNDVRPATLTVSAPDWASVRIGQVEQDAGICAARQAPERTEGNWMNVLRQRIALVAGYGLSMTPRGVIEAQATVAAGVRIW